MREARMPVFLSAGKSSIYAAILAGFQRLMLKNLDHA